MLANTEDISAADLEQAFKALAEEKDIKAGELMLPFRIMFVGSKFGVSLFYWVRLKR
jgi:glutamyl-tRNA synthetase